MHNNVSYLGNEPRAGPGLVDSHGNLPLLLICLLQDVRWLAWWLLLLRVLRVLMASELHIYSLVVAVWLGSPFVAATSSKVVIIIVPVWRLGSWVLFGGPS